MALIYGVVVVHDNQTEAILRLVFRVKSWRTVEVWLIPTFPCHLACDIFFSLTRLSPNTSSCIDLSSLLHVRF